jgi:hypothetical protein
MHLHLNSYKKVFSEMPEYIKYGIHVMISQHEIGEITLGDSPGHRYTIDPFDDYYINNYLLTNMVLCIILIG